MLLEFAGLTGERPAGTILPCIWRKQDIMQQITHAGYSCHDAHLLYYTDKPGHGIHVTKEVLTVVKSLHCLNVIMDALCNRADHSLYFCPVISIFFLLFFLA